MTTCKDCIAPLLCGASLEDHIADGEEREIVGCDSEQYFYGRLLKDAPDYWRFHIGEQENGGSRQGGGR